MLDIKRFFIAFTVFAFISCNDKAKDPYADFENEFVSENVGSVTFDWTWGSSGNREVATKFTVDQYSLGGNAIICNVENKTGMISDVFTYRSGAPDTDPAKRAWIVEYSGAAKSVNIKWNGKLELLSNRDTTSTVEVVFQVYAVIPPNVAKQIEEEFDDNDNWLGYGRWPEMSNNLRPQIDMDTLFLGTGFDADVVNELRENARGRMIARYYNTSAFKDFELDENENKVWVVEIDDVEGEYIFPPLPSHFSSDSENPPPKYFMQLFVRIYSNDPKKSNTEYRIDNGKLEINFVN